MGKLLSGGTVFVLVVGIIILWGMFGWIQDSFQGAQTSADDQRRQALECSSISISYPSVRENSTHTNVLLESNTDLDRLNIVFRSPQRNYTRTLEDVKGGLLVRSNVPTTNVSSIEASVPGCDREFRVQ